MHVECRDLTPGGPRIAALRVLPTKLETLTVKIPLVLYEKDHAIRLVFKKGTGTYAFCQNIRLYRYERQGKSGGGGGQSAEIVDLQKSTELRILPTVATNTITISYNLALPTKVSIQLFDITGRIVKPILEKRQNAGNHKVTFDTDRFANGVYFLKFKTSAKTETRKIVISK